MNFRNDFHPAQKRSDVTAKIHTSLLHFINLLRPAKCRSRATLEGDTDQFSITCLDPNAAFELVKEFEEPAVVIKHLNPCVRDRREHLCGVPQGILGDVISVFGGIVA